MLTHDKKRLLLSVVGVAFAVFLMFIEMGFLNGVYDSQTLLVSKFDADLVMFHSLKEDVTPPRPFDLERLSIAQQFEEVESVTPLYLREKNIWRNPITGTTEPILVIAYDPNKSVLLAPDLDRLRPLLLQPETALIDAKSRDFYGVTGPGTVSELNGKRIRISGKFELGPNFRVDGNLLMSDRNYSIYGRDPRSRRPATDNVEFGLIKLKPGVDAEQTLARIAAALPSDVRILTKDGLVASIRRFWATNQPVGTVFGLGMVVGFVIGVTICYQILFTDIANHSAEFATLKAIGYPNRYLVKVVLMEGLLLALFGYLPGLVTALALFSRLEELTGITMRLTPHRVGLVFAMTITMCLLSATIAIRKVLSADPAEVF